MDPHGHLLTRLWGHSGTPAHFRRARDSTFPFDLPREPTDASSLQCKRRSASLGNFVPDQWNFQNLLKPLPLGSEPTYSPCCSRVASRRLAVCSLSARPRCTPQTFLRPEVDRQPVQVQVRFRPAARRLSARCPVCASVRRTSSPSAAICCC